MTSFRLPYVQEFRDRHGTIRRYVRKPGLKRTAIKGCPGTEEFRLSYEAALAGIESRPNVGEARTRPGTINAAIVAYYNSNAFQSGLKRGTQGMRRAILERFRETNGEKRIATLPTKFIVGTLARMKPFAAKNWLKTLRGFLKFAVADEMCAFDPTQGIKLASIKSDGIHTWTEEEIEQFEAEHAIGTRPRLALALLLHTAQRRSDVIRMGRQHVRDGTISVRQDKTGTRLEIPVHPTLKRVLAKTPVSHLTFLTTDKGEPYTAAGFGNAFRDWCNEAGLPRRCSAHGLRKAACRRLAEAGCTTNQIAAVSGHKSLSEVQRYTKAAEQAHLAREAMRTVQGKKRTGSVKPPRFGLTK